MGTAGADPSISTAVSTAVSAPATKWFDALDDENKNYINSRGLGDTDPIQAFLNAAKAHRDAQAFIGVPTEQVLKLPKSDAPPEEWDAVWQKLGYSTNKDDYKLEAVTDEGLRSFIQAQAAALHLSPTAAAKFAGETTAYLEKTATAQSSEEQIANVRAAEQLRNSWGPNYQANMTIADRAYLAIQAAAGFTAEQMQANMTKLKEANGTEGVMQMLLAVGQRIGEDGFVAGGVAPTDPASLIASREQAIARKAELSADEEWRKRFLNGGVAEVREMAALDMRISPPDA